MSIESQDKLLKDAMYWCREKQARDISSFAEDQTEGTLVNLGDAGVLLGKALEIPSAFLPIYLNEINLTREEFLRQINPAVLTLEKGRITMRILGNLLRACSFESRGITEVAVDSTVNVLPSVLKLIYGHNIAELEAIEADGAEMAALGVLNLLSAGTPLLRYRRDLALKAGMVLQQSDYGGHIGSIPTIIPNVDQRYYYPSDSQRPILSIVVRPFP